MDLLERLSASFTTGFIDHSAASAREFRPELVTNDKKAGKKVLTTILRELESCDEFWFSIAFVTTGGVAALINTLVELERKGVQGKILASQYLNFTQPEALRRIRQFSNIELKIDVLNRSHSKGYLFKKGEVYTLLVGSSNLTQAALSVNKEWNLKISAASEGEIVKSVLAEYKQDFEAATLVTDDFLEGYQRIIDSLRRLNQEAREEQEALVEVKPNQMQEEALLNLRELRTRGCERALLISATGTGKTYLAAFDVLAFKPRRFLFVVHRRNIALAAMKTFRKLLGDGISMGLYSGSKQEISCDFLFATVQTISKSEHLNLFDPDHFDYIVIDESHRAGAASYGRIIDHFDPTFMLGMTATPERTDGLDVFSLFDHNIAYEIRLNKALEEEMVSPFHYYGVADLTVNGAVVDDVIEFNYLTVEERVDRIIEKTRLYGCDSGDPRGLVFCSLKEEANFLSLAFNRKGFRTVSLTGDSSEADRIEAINRLESERQNDRLDYIFTVDIFNEGVDIPKVNQIVMLRPTQSAIIFVQQMGRGLRKHPDKDYLTVIDFIGNYQNNYLVPVALYGDNSYNKDVLRKLITSGSRFIPGCSTVNFERIAKEAILQSIDAKNMQLAKDLKRDYELLKFKLGRVPMMVDFLADRSRDPYLFVKKEKSYYHFVARAEKWGEGLMDALGILLLKFFANEINNAKRVEESILLKLLLGRRNVNIADFEKAILEKYKRSVSPELVGSVVNNLNFQFATETKGKRESIGNLYDLQTLHLSDGEFKLSAQITDRLNNDTFRRFLIDNTDYAIDKYDAFFDEELDTVGFIRYQKYTRKDVFRALNWSQNPMAQNVGGYMVSKDKRNCAIFVNYHKAEGISGTTKYDDGFVSPSEFKWMSKSKRKLSSPDVRSIRYEKMRLPLFVKKHNDEGDDFYFMGDMTPIDESFEQATLNGASVVKVRFKMDQSVDEEVYRYITEEA
ncbi:MAG: DEAD/DEAH box helicase [Lewinella sp.]|nr:DEAD/DEAH box helicase [Lewinella sp.]